MASTQFLPAERASQTKVLSQADLFRDHPNIVSLLDGVPTHVIILNSQRQIVLCNRAFGYLCNCEDKTDALGQRPGEALGCIHADENVFGCGTTEFCRTCGAARSILKAQQGMPNMQECRILQRFDQGGKAFDLRVWSTPLDFEGERFTLFAVLDISDEKRREVLERIFFHDVLNTANDLLGFTSLLAGDPEGLNAEMLSVMHKASVSLVDEIKTQRQLLAAERLELKTMRETIRSQSFLRSIVEEYRDHGLARNRGLSVSGESEDVLFPSDRTLLRRVIVNMVKNALEAVKEGEAVSLACSKNEDTIRFSVHNPGVIPRDVQLQLFNRSFSTKGKDRGLGTYSIKLLTEQYLGGEVGFESLPHTGTVFHVTLPMEPEDTPTVEDLLPNRE